MGDEYDFEIALPAAPTNASRSTRHHHSSSGSDEDVSNTSGSLSSMSSISSDDDSGRGRHRTESGFKKATKSTIEPKSAGTLSALDRGNKFLSKYSGDSKAKASRRVNLDSDDEDFPMEFSTDDDKKDANKKLGVTSNTMITSSRDSNPPQSSKQQVVGTQADGRQEADLSYSDEEAEISRNSDHPPPYSSSNAVVSRLEDRSSDRSEVGDSIESFHSGVSGERSEKLTVEIPRPTLAKESYQSQHEESAVEYEESFQEESLTQEVGTKQPCSASAFTSVRLQQSVASESGSYDEEAFDEDSTAVAGTPAHNSSTRPATNTEKNFDYSMDFSDDENEGHPQLEIHTSQLLAINDPVREDSTGQDPESRSISSRSGIGSDGEQSAFLESNSFREDEHDELEHVPVVSRVVEPQMGADNILPGVVQSKQLPESVAADKELRHEPISAVPVTLSSLTDNTEDRLSSNTDTSPVPAAPPQKILSQQQSSHAGQGTAAAKRPRVEIVRAYKLEEDTRVEMKDASTQFTGNHAAIQTDLVPDGMHNLFVSSSPAPTPPSVPDNDACSRDTKPSHSSQQPPPPPISPMLGTSMYSLDALKLPMVSTSLYKQQLLALQEQILQKKLETERIVQDRMAFQYSSLRGTERFIATRRAQKMELWEALMRVDPTLDERKARETARLAQAATT